jgi:hypothetical protein
MQIRPLRRRHTLRERCDAEAAQEENPYAANFRPMPFHSFSSLETA